jgi:hypothetical protein
VDLSTVASIASELGALGVSLLVLVGLITERLVPKGRLDDMRRERDAADNRADELASGFQTLGDILRQR